MDGIQYYWNQLPDDALQALDLLDCPHPVRL